MDTALLIFLALVAFICFMPRAFNPQPKKGRRSCKPRRPIPARSGRIKRGAVWNRYKAPSPADIAFMERCRMQNIAQSAGAQPTIRMKEALHQLGIAFKQEEPIWFDGNRFVLADFWLPGLKIAIEAQGSQHRLERERDADKAAIIMGQRGFRVLEYWNREIMRPGFTDRLRKDLLGGA